MATKTSPTLDPREVLKQRRVELDQAEQLLSRREEIDQQLGRLGLLTTAHPFDGQAARMIGKARGKGGPKVSEVIRKSTNGVRHDGPRIADLLEKAIRGAGKPVQARELSDLIKGEYTGRAKDPYMVVLNTLKTDKRFHRRKVRGSRTFEYDMRQEAPHQ